MTSTRRFSTETFAGSGVTVEEQRRGVLHIRVTLRDADYSIKRLDGNCH